MAAGSTDPLVHSGEVKTSLHCHECGKDFVALLDYSLDGNHVVQCAHCGHEHCRVITKGKITEDRWSSRYGTDKTKDGIKARRVWKDNVLPMKTYSSAEIMREMFLRDRFR